MFEHIDVQAIGVITPVVTYGSVNSVTTAYAISEVWWEQLSFMTINKQFVLEEIKIYSGSTNVSVKKYGLYCFRRRLILENRNSAQDLRRVFIPCGLGKDLSFDLEIIWKYLYLQPKRSSEGKQSFTGKHSAVSTLGSLMTCWMMPEAWTLSMAATDIMKGGEKAAEVRRHTNPLQLWLGKLAK